MKKMEKKKGLRVLKKNNNFTMFLEIKNKRILKFSCKAFI